MTTEHIVKALQETKPISVVMTEKIKEIEKWAKDKARFASSLAETEAKGAKKVKVKGGKPLELSGLDNMEEIAPPKVKKGRLAAVEHDGQEDDDSKN